MKTFKKWAHAGFVLCVCGVAMHVLLWAIKMIANDMAQTLCCFR